jgi:hypothetical protein
MESCDSLRRRRRREAPFKRFLISRVKVSSK